MIASELVGAGEDAGRALGDSRARVLAVLQDAGRPMGVPEVAPRVGLHENTARFHLDGLIASGLVDRSMQVRAQPGRPRVLYAARPGTAPAGRRSYRLLAEVLTSYLAAGVPQPRQAGVRAGQEWGRFLSERLPPFRRLDANAATERLVATLAEIGFEPEAVTTARRRRVLLHHCPFRETAQAHPSVVCSVHLGLMQGLLAGIDAPVDTQRLDPFVEPDLCVATLVVRKRQPPTADLSRHGVGPA
ncbi:MAG TPA: helix-turn-helix domain-containing protein [Micromonosporaceae bacterium]